MKKQNKKLRIMFNSNAHWSVSGYGTQMYYLLPYLRDKGWNQALIAFYGLEGNKINIDGIEVFPKMHDVWGADAMVEHGKRWNADVTVSLQDVWVLNDQALRAVKRWIPYVPIDHDPVQPAVIERLKLAYRIITYSKFGQQQLRKNGLYSTYIPHVVDTNTFKPVDKAKVRQQLGIPEKAFVFGMVAANKENPPRKSFQEALDAFKVFHDKHPEAVFYFHSNVAQQGGFPIHEYAKFLGIASAIYFPPVYDWMFSVDRNQMASIVGMLDCLLSPSVSEGFGVPIIEAQSCEVPVIVNRFASMTELVEEDVTGLVSEVAYKRFSPLLSYVGIPDYKSIYEKMEQIFEMDRAKMGRAGREKMIKEYDVSVVMPKWDEFFEKVEKEVYKDIANDKSEVL